MSDGNNTYELTRRKALAGLGTIGVASAGAGLGTSAFFSDTESFDGNMLTAGTLDLVVNYNASVDQGSAGSFSVNGTNNGNDPKAEFSITDVKPGDSGTAEFCFEIDDNPAYLWACGELAASAENGYTEPEPKTEADGDTNDPGNSSGGGELEDAIEVDVLYCQVSDSGTGSATRDSTGDTIYSGTLREVLDQLHGGIPLDGTGNGDAKAGSQAPYDGTNNSSGTSGVDNPCVCFDFSVPTSVGNEIQGDSLEFDLQFYAEQARHNDGSHNPCLEGETGSGFAKLRDDFSPSLNARGRFGDNDAGTTTGLRELDIRDASDAPQAQDGHSWTNGTAEPFELSYDGTTTTLTVGGDTVSTSAVSPSDDDLAIGVGASGGTVEVSGVEVNGQTPRGASGVSATGDNEYLFVAGGGLSAGDSVTGEVTFSWDSSSTPGEEGLKFRIDA